MAVRTFTARDGAQIAYRDEGAGRPLLLLHGLMAHGGFFDAQAPLADAFRLVSIDFRGHGASRGAGGAPALAQLADDVATLAETLNLRDAVGLGWSLGAAVLWQVLSGRAADRFAASVIVDMTPCVRNRDDWDLGLTDDICAARSAAIRDDFPAFARGAGEAIFPPPRAAAETATWAGEAFAASDPAAIASLWASLSEQDLRALLPGIGQPSLIVRGAHSHLYGAGTAAYLARTLPDARVIEFAESGHAPHVEQAAAFNDTLRAFAAGLPHVRDVPKLVQQEDFA